MEKLGIFKSIITFSITTRYTQDSFVENHAPTIGYAFRSRDLKLGAENGQKEVIRLHIWDTAGEEAYKSMTKFFYRDTSLGLIVYDITSKVSFNNLNGWVKDFKDQCPDAKVIIVGNKIDLEENRNVEDRAVQQYASENGFIHLTCSAKENKGINEIFERVGKELGDLNSKIISVNPIAT